jgi:hypothetical protein
LHRHAVNAVEPFDVVLLFNPQSVAEATFWAHQLPWGQIVHVPFVPKYPALHWHAVIAVIPDAVVLLFDPHAVSEVTFWVHQLPCGQMVQLPLDP